MVGVLAARFLRPLEKEGGTRRDRYRKTEDIRADSAQARSSKQSRRAYNGSPTPPRFFPDRFAPSRSTIAATRGNA